jgi:hypothetical protein
MSIVNHDAGAVFARKTDNLGQIANLAFHVNTPSVRLNAGILVGGTRSSRRSDRPCHCGLYFSVLAMLRRVPRQYGMVGLSSDYSHCGQVMDEMMDWFDWKRLKKSGSLHSAKIWQACSARHANPAYR